jgi:hypothetical protein
MSSPIDDTEVFDSGTNSIYDESGSTLIQPAKQISLDVGMQSNYTVLPALREDLYSISSVGDINGLLAGYPVPHKWQPDPSGSPHVLYHVDQWSDTGTANATTNDPAVTSLRIRNQLFNQFVTSKTPGFQTAINDTAHGEMYFTESYRSTALNLGVGAADVSGVMQAYDESGGMVSTVNLFNEYLTDDGTVGGDHLSSQADGANRDDQLQGTLFGQVQEALINWFEAANYKDASSASIVDPEQHDILRSWMSRASNVRNRHLAKFSEEATKRLISVESSTPEELDLSGQNTLMYCCFDAEQVKQIFSTVEATGRIREDVSGSTHLAYSNEIAHAAPAYSITEPNMVLAGEIKDDSGNDVLQSEVKKEDGSIVPIPRHFVAMRHGEGFAIIIPAKTRLRSGTISEANLVLRLFQEHKTAVADGFA